MTRKKKGKTGSVSAVSHVILKKKWRLITCGHIFIYAYIDNIYIYIVMQNTYNTNIINPKIGVKY